MAISSVHPSCFASFAFGGIVLSDFPHSRHNRFARGVIKPQNGHILWARNGWGCG